MLKDLFYKKRHRYATVAQTNRRPRPEIPDEVPPRDVPKGLVEKCKGCGALLMARELQKHAYTCPHCNYHFPIGGQERLEMLLDEGSFEEFDAALSSEDPLGFPGYREKVEKAQQATNLAEGVVTGAGRIDGQALVVGVMDSRFIMGSMGSAVGEKLTRAMEAALARQCPMVLFTASGGARMQEGILSLMQMAKTSA
ncbi:MAG: acetyl-CoA carboxylase carboxyl transferase subunit beta, partial [Alicyclobacillus shizuokensis]|nr:acetyl-CoA carboxylase carboxyl transferase subunit beta [Alicyclobacillus shizuokensis]